MIGELDRQLEEGIITKEFHDRRVDELEEKRKLYEGNKKPKKKHIFKKFKDKLTGYKKK